MPTAAIPANGSYKSLRPTLGRSSPIQRVRSLAEPPRTAKSVRPIFDPTDDGKPLGATEFHSIWGGRLREPLAHHLTAPRFAVRRDRTFARILLFYRKGDPEKFIVPAVFTVPFCDAELRQNFRILEMQTSPDVVVVPTSSKTHKNDHGWKKSLYRRLVSREYFLYDVTGDYMEPVLHGYRLTPAKRYARITPTLREPLTLCSKPMELRPELRADNWLNLYDELTYERLRTGPGGGRRTSLPNTPAEGKPPTASHRGQSHHGQSHQGQAAELARLSAEKARQDEEQTRIAADAEVARLQAVSERPRGD